MTHRHAIGIDLGGTAVKYGICAEDGVIAAEFERPSNAGGTAAALLDVLADAAREALAEADRRGLAIAAIGLGTPGCVDVARGFIRGNTPNFADWTGVPVREELLARLDRQVTIDNDANMMAYGESRFGAGQGVDDLLCITLGTGIGGGVILDGRLFRGSRHAGGELGHILVCDGEGGVDYWEKLASATAMITRYNRLRPDAPVTSTRPIFEREARGEAAAREVVEREVRLVGIGLASLVNAFNPARVLVGGGVSEAGDAFVARIAAVVREWAIEAAREGLEIRRARLGNKAGWLGAAALALAVTEG